VTDTTAPTRGSWRRALWGGFLSLISSGLGQIYAGSWPLGIALYVAEWALEIAIIALTWVAPPAPLPFAAAAGVFIAFRLAVAIDAAWRIRVRFLRGPVPWNRSAWVAAIVMASIDAGVTFGIAPRDTVGWKTYSIPSASDMPTLLPGDYIGVDVRRPSVAPAYGDMVVFRLPRDPEVDYIKRVVGLPGDHVQIRQGIVYLNHKPIPREPVGFSIMSSTPVTAGFKQYRETLSNGRTYSVLEKADDSAINNTIEYEVPPDSLFVLGDNRDDSLDSRLLGSFGYVPIENVIGTARTIYWAHDPFRMLTRVE
jgi:signal peptidase I